MVKAWIWLLLHARSEETKWQGITLEVGQLVTSYPSFAANIGASEKQARLILERLKRTGEVELNSSNRYTIVTICKYDTYQVNDNEEGQAEGQADGQTEGRQKADKGQRIKNDNTSKKDTLSKESISKESSKAYGKTEFIKDLESIGIPHQIALDWCAARERKSRPYTKTAFNGTVRELNKIPDKTPGELITIAAEKGWGGFEARYYFESISRTQQQNNYGRNPSNTGSSKEILGDGIYESTI